jgi:hypothetical protein
MLDMSATTQQLIFQCNTTPVLCFARDLNLHIEMAESDPIRKIRPNLNPIRPNPIRPEIKWLSIQSKSIKDMKKHSMQIDPTRPDPISSKRSN